MCWERSTKWFLSLWKSSDSSYRPVYVLGTIEKAVLTSVAARTYRAVYVPGKIEKAIFTSVEAL